jgi:predicted amidohydrolase
MKVSSINFKINKISHKDDFFNHVNTVLLEAIQKDAELIVLPEYTVAELYSLFPSYSEEDAPSLLVRYAKEYVSTLEEFSKKHSVTIVGGTFFSDAFGGISNVCPITSNTHATRFQIKNQLVSYENQIQKLSRGTKIEILDDTRIGVLICYDSEFPEYCRTLCQAGMQILCVPSSTETVHGFNRVRFSCLARAIENQIYVIHSALVGSINKEPHPTSYGSSAVISPCSAEFPSGPILNETPLHEEGSAFYNLHLNLLYTFQNQGEVQNFNDWKNTFCRS